MSQYHDVLDVSYYILKQIYEKDECITNRELNNLLYLLWIDFYKNTQKYLFKKEMAAWPLGPTSLHVFYKFVLHGGRAIDSDTVNHLTVSPLNVSTIEKTFLDKRIHSYARYSKNDVIKWIQRPFPSSAWDVVYRNSGRDTFIPFQKMIEYDCQYISYGDTDKNHSIQEIPLDM